MRTVKVAGAALNQTPLAWDENCAHIIEAIENARGANVSILCLPELCITGYGCEDTFYAAGTRNRAIESLNENLRPTATRLPALAISVPPSYIARPDSLPR